MLHFWGRLWRFILVNPLPFALKIIIKDRFFLTLINEPFLCFEDCLSLWIYDLPYSPHLEYEEPKPSACSLFLSFLKWQPIMNWDMLRSVLTLEYFCADYIPLILFKHLIGILVWVYPSMTNPENETLKTIFRLGVQLWYLGHEHCKWPLAISLAFWLFLNSQEIKCRIRTFIFFYHSSMRS